MNITEVGDTFNCDCGFSWTRGFSGSHDCGDGLRRQIADLKVQILANLQAQPVGFYTSICERGGVIWHNGAPEDDTAIYTAPPSPAVPTPVNFSENADADMCRKWAWEQVKEVVSTDGWTLGDNITYFGFFCWGWDMRRQYNEQRPPVVNPEFTGATAVPDERAAFNAWNNEDNLPIAGIPAKNAAWLAWQARAMLAQPVSQGCKLPDNVREALALALQAMEFMGDTLNNIDAVCTEDVEYVTPAFTAVRELLAAAPATAPDEIEPDSIDKFVAQVCGDLTTSNRQ